MTAVAVLFTYTKEGEAYTDAFSSDDGYEDPEFHCEQVRAAIGDDFPGAVFAIGVNEEAREIMKARRMRSMGFEDQ